MDTGEISHRQMSASLQWGDGHAAAQRRLHFKASGHKNELSVRDEKMSINVFKLICVAEHIVTPVATQERNNYPNQWVSTLTKDQSGCVHALCDLLKDKSALFLSFFYF